MNTLKKFLLLFLVLFLSKNNSNPLSNLQDFGKSLDKNLLPSILLLTSNFTVYYLSKKNNKENFETKDYIKKSAAPLSLIILTTSNIFNDDKYKIAFKTLFSITLGITPLFKNLK